MTQLSPRKRTPPLHRRGDLLPGGQALRRPSRAQQAVTWDPSFAEAHLLVGKAYFLLGDNHKATPPLDRALELNPRLTEALFLKGSAFKNRKRIEEAADFFVEAIQSDETYIPAYLALGQLLLENGAAEEAAGVLLSGMKHQPGNGNLRFLLAGPSDAGQSPGSEGTGRALKSIDTALAKKLEQLCSQ